MLTNSSKSFHCHNINSIKNSKDTKWVLKSIILARGKVFLSNIPKQRF